MSANVTSGSLRLMHNLLLQPHSTQNIVSCPGSKKALILILKERKKEKKRILKIPRGSGKVGSR